jgi:hypothetical protein
MVRDAEATARNAEASHTNSPGYCLQWSRERADIAAMYPDAATAWKYAHHRHKGDRNPPRGAMVYWLGGSSGYGHIAVALGNGKVRSTDAGGAGEVATVDVGWPERAWGLPYAGWADNVNNVIIPGVGDEDMDLDDQIGEWSPDDGDTGKTTVGKTLNQARGYSEDAYERVKRLENSVKSLSEKVDKILNAVT